MSNAKFTDLETIGVKEVVEAEEKRRKDIAEATLISEDVEKGIKRMRSKNGAMMLVKMSEEERIAKMPKKDGDAKVEWVSPIKAPKMAWYGYAVKCEGDFNEENLEKAKEIVLNEICETIRDVARTVPNDFFIVHNKDILKNKYKDAPEFLRPSDEELDAMNYFTVGCKIELPSAYTEE